MKCPLLKEGSGLPECNAMVMKNGNYFLSEFHYEEFCIEKDYKICPFFMRNLETVLSAILKAA